MPEAVHRCRVLAVVADLDPEFEIGMTRLTKVDDTVDLSPLNLETINGLRSSVRLSQSRDGGVGSAEVKVLDEDVVISITFLDPDDTELALRIIDTIRATP